MASVDETPGSPLSINHLYQTLQQAGKAAHDVLLRKQAPFKGTRKTKRDLQGVWKTIKGLEMPQGDWVQDSWKKSEH